MTLSRRRGRKQYGRHLPQGDTIEKDKPFVNILDVIEPGRTGSNQLDAHFPRKRNQPQRAGGEL